MACPFGQGLKRRILHVFLVFICHILLPSWRICQLADLDYQQSSLSLEKISFSAGYPHEFFIKFSNVLVLCCLLHPPSNAFGVHPASPLKNGNMSNQVQQRKWRKYNLHCSRETHGYEPIVNSRVMNQRNVRERRVGSFLHLDAASTSDIVALTKVCNSLNDSRPYYVHTYRIR